MSDSRELRVEHLLSHRVHDANGEYVGRIEEIRAERRGDDCFVTEYHVGNYAYMERLSSMGIGRAILRVARLRNGYRVLWDQMDLSNPKKLHTTVRRAELAKLRG